MIPQSLDDSLALDRELGTLRVIYPPHDHEELLRRGLDLYKEAILKFGTLPAAFVLPIALRPPGADGAGVKIAKVPVIWHEDGHAGLFYRVGAPA